MFKFVRCEGIRNAANVMVWNPESMYRNPESISAEPVSFKWNPESTGHLDSFTEDDF